MEPLAVVILSSAQTGTRVISGALEGTLAHVTREEPLPDREGLVHLLENDFEVLIVDLDHDTERALELVEATCTLRPEITIMVYSRNASHNLILRSMRAGAREFLTDPLSNSVIAEALVRASARHEETSSQKKARGRLVVFVGAKGGVGASTVASNFAVALTKESGERVALVDMNLQLGDSALCLGLSGEFSTLDALRDENRLDSELISKFLLRHESGLQVLSAPDRMVTGEEVKFVQPEPNAVMKMMRILTNDFSWVVIDAGCDYGQYAPRLFEAAEKIYLVSQVSVVELRNCHRVIKAFFSGDLGGKLEVILNRYTPRSAEIDETNIAKALTLPSLANVWKIPNDFQSVRAAQNSATALASKDSAVTRALAGIAKAVCGKTVAPETAKRRFGLFRK